MSETNHLDSKTKTLVFHVEGDVTSNHVARYGGELDALLATYGSSPVNWDTFRMDITAASMVDSVGLNMIVSILKRIQKLGAKMQVSYKDPNVHRTLMFTRLDRHVQMLKAD
jgi:anti-anti-sigma factor